MKYFITSDTHGFYSILRDALIKAGFWSEGMMEETYFCLDGHVIWSCSGGRSDPEKKKRSKKRLLNQAIMNYSKKTAQEDPNESVAMQ